MASHYARMKTTRQYLACGLNVQKMFDLYEEDVVSKDGSMRSQGMTNHHWGALGSSQGSANKMTFARGSDPPGRSAVGVSGRQGIPRRGSRQRHQKPLKLTCLAPGPLLGEYECPRPRQHRRRQEHHGILPV